MTEIAPISCDGLSKQFGDVRAVSDLAFEAPAGAVTGFVGANGAGKTTTIRMLLGLVEPSAGGALIDGTRYRELPAPRRTVGAVLDTPGAHPGHTARTHLEIVGAACGIGRTRIVHVLDQVQLTEDSTRRVGTYSLGMRQRLSLAAALLGDPPILILDEPTKGLDPPGIRWLRLLLRGFADDGRCVLISSHHLAELEAIADRVVMIDRGHLIADSLIGPLVGNNDVRILVKTPAPDALLVVINAAGGACVSRSLDELLVTGLTLERVGDLAAEASIPLHGLSEQKRELEEVFFSLTSDTETIS